MLTVLGENVNPPPGATVTSTIVLVADGTPFTSGWPFSSTMVIGAIESFCGRAVVRLSPDSARTKKTMANVVASQKATRPAFDFFILVTPFLRASIAHVVASNRRRRCAVQRQRYCAQPFKRGKEFFGDSP
jgi:hypothetical protein